MAMLAAPAAAQEGQAPGVQGADDPDNIGRANQGVPALNGEVPGENTTGTREIAFEANGVSYNSDTDTVTAEGDVVLRSEEQSVRADAVSWNRTTGQIVATGNIRFVDEDGNQLFTDRLELTDELSPGVIHGEGSEGYSAVIMPMRI